MREVCEKGVTLSGGQKQCINIARVLYHNCDITIFNNSFSALDVRVAESVFENVLKKALDSKTRHPPRVLDYETQVVVPGELDGFLNVLRRSGVGAGYWHVTLLAQIAEGGVEVAALDRPVGKGVCLVVGVFGSVG